MRYILFMSRKKALIVMCLLVMYRLWQTKLSRDKKIADEILMLKSSEIVSKNI